jgi:hypothetical protein
MKPRFLRRSTPCLLLSACFCAVQPLAAGNVQGCAKAVAAAAVLYLAVHQGGFVPEAPLPAVEDPSLHQQELAFLQQRYARALETGAFMAALDRTQRLDAPPEDPLADWNCVWQAELFSPGEFGTEDRYATFRAHIDRQKALFATLAEASARKVAERQQALDDLYRLYSVRAEGRDLDTELEKQQLAVRMAQLLDRLYQPIHRLLQGVCCGGLTDLDAIRRLDQGVRETVQAAAPRLDREQTHNLVLARILELERTVARRQLQLLKVQQRRCLAATFEDQIRTQKMALRDMGRELAEARGRAAELDAAMTALRDLVSWSPGINQTHPGSEASGRPQDEEISPA